MDTQLTSDWNGVPLVFDARHALYVPGSGDLLVADVHVGKSELFRREGMPMPPGDLGGDLARLRSLVIDHAPRRLVVLGDWVHHRDGLSQPVIDAVAAWRATVPVPMLLVRGNHERTVTAMPAAWCMNEVEGSHGSGPLTYTHEPPESPDVPTVCGHVHPAIRLGPRTRSLRLPCFWLRQRTLVLPGFGMFTGSHTVRPGASERAFVCADGALIRA